MVMRPFRNMAVIYVCVSVLWTTGSPARATESANIPSFHRVLVVNNTPRQAVIPTELGLLTADLETQQADGQWHAVAKLRAPTGTHQSVVFHAGEIWQFLMPGSAMGLPVKVRLVLSVVGGTIYSQAFEMNVDLLSASQTVDCWLARIRPAKSEHGPVIAAANQKRDN